MKRTLSLLFAFALMFFCHLLVAQILGLHTPSWPNGLNILNGVTDPTPSAGKDGEFYINTTTLLLFGPKTSGAWPSGVSLVGATEAQGPQGSAGARGVQGPAGISISWLGTLASAPATPVLDQVYYNSSAKTSPLYYRAQGGAWTNVSDRNKKENFTRLDGQEILNLIIRLPITRWNYKGETASVTHIGPMAQDFYRLFKTGSDDTSISTIDPAGISLAAIQELIHQMDELRKIIINQKESIDTLRGENAQLKATVNDRLQKLEEQIGIIVKSK